MSRDYSLVLEDILDAITKIRRFTESRSDPSQLFDDDQALDAVLYNIEVVGEAVKKIPDWIRKRYPQVDWKRIAGMRDKLIHHYHEVDQEIVWQVVKVRLPVLEEQIKKIQSELKEQ